MRTLTGGVCWISVWSWILYHRVGGRHGFPWTGSSLVFQKTWLSAREIECRYGLDRMSWFWALSEKMYWLPEIVFCGMLSTESVADYIIDSFNQDQTDAWWKVIQFRAGIASVNAFLDAAEIAIVWRWRNRHGQRTLDPSSFLVAQTIMKQNRILRKQCWIASTHASVT